MTCTNSHIQAVSQHGIVIIVIACTLYYRVFLVAVYICSFTFPSRPTYTSTGMMDALTTVVNLSMKSLQLVHVPSGPGPSNFPILYASLTTCISSLEHTIHSLRPALFSNHSGSLSQLFRDLMNVLDTGEPSMLLTIDSEL